jgi:transcriptional regulator
MYIPPSNAETRPDVILDFIEAHPFGVLITAGEDGLFATHLPFVLDRSAGGHGVLLGHIARANPHHRQTLTTPESLVIFSRPDAYVTPSWYPTKAEHGKVVPTWNYVAVHLYGVVHFVDDPEFVHPHLEALTAQSERHRDHPWSLHDAPADFVEAQAWAILGVRFEITRLEGKWKMSQNRPAVDIDGAVRGLAESEDPRERQLADIMRERRPRER